MTAHSKIDLGCFSLSLRQALADVRNDTIRKVTSEGVVTTLAGLAMFRGNADGAGSTARFNLPQYAPGGDGGNAGSYSGYAPGSAAGGPGGGGGGGGMLALITPSLIDHSTKDLSGGAGGEGGSGQIAGVATGGQGGIPQGVPGAKSPDLPPGNSGPSGSAGKVSVSGWPLVGWSGWTWYKAGEGQVGFVSATNHAEPILGLSTDQGPLTLSTAVQDPAPGAPLELKFAYRWFSLNGALEISLGGQKVLRLDAPSQLSNGFVLADVTVTN